VNALLTGLDKLRHKNNVKILLNKVDEFLTFQII